MKKKPLPVPAPLPTVKPASLLKPPVKAAAPLPASVKPIVRPVIDGVPIDRPVKPNGHAAAPAAPSKMVYDDDSRLADELENIQDQLRHWRERVEAHETELERIKDQAACALVLYEDSKSRLTPHPAEPNRWVGHIDARGDLKAAQTVLDRCKEDEINEEKLLRVAKASYALWQERKMDFPMDRLRAYKATYKNRQNILRASRPRID